MKRPFAVVAFSLAAVSVTGMSCPLMQPEACSVTTTSGAVDCSLESNGRYACSCGDCNTFVSNDFCMLSADEQDAVGELECTPCEGEGEGEGE